MALRKAINEGRVPGPRMRAAGHGIGITGGHADSNGYKPGLVDGTYQGRHRRRRRRNAAPRSATR